MDKAEQASGGTVVSIIAYKADHVAAHEELKLIDETRRAKKCDGLRDTRHRQTTAAGWELCSHPNNMSAVIRAFEEPA